MKNKTVVAMVLAGVVAGGVAGATVPRAQVTVLSGVAGSPAAVRPTRPVVPRVTPLDPAALVDAKAETLARFRAIGRHPAPQGLTGPLTLDISHWQATVGSVRGGMSVAGVVAQWPTGTAPDLDFAYWNGIVLDEVTGGNEEVSLVYDGLSNGALYLVDCPASGLGTAQVIVENAPANGPAVVVASSAVSPSSQHLLVSFQAIAAEMFIEIAPKTYLSAGGAGAWYFDGCTLHPVG